MSAAFVQSGVKTHLSPNLSRLFGDLKEIQRISCGVLWWMKLEFTIRPESNKETTEAVNVYFEDLEKTFGRESRSWKNVGLNVLSFEGIILKNKI